MTDIKVAALYVMPGGPYFNTPGVDPWDESRDARKYKGPFPVVAHPPCERWGRYWGGGPMLHGTPAQKLLGDDGGCFAHALWAVRTFGGVIEHPEASAAWGYYGLVKPPRQGGWVAADNFGGWTCCVSQGHYGHRAQKATWLYVCGVGRAELPELVWGKCEGKQLIDESLTRAERARLVRTGICQRLSRRQRLQTPEEFKELLISLAIKAAGVTRHEN
jgi:hypothetical protein